MQEGSRSLLQTSYGEIRPSYGEICPSERPSARQVSRRDGSLRRWLRLQSFLKEVCESCSLARELRLALFSGPTEDPRGRHRIQVRQMSTFSDAFRGVVALHFVWLRLLHFSSGIHPHFSFFVIPFQSSRSNSTCSSFISTSFNI